MEDVITWYIIWLCLSCDNLLLDTKKVKSCMVKHECHKQRINGHGQGLSAFTTWQLKGCIYWLFLGTTYCWKTHYVRSGCMGSPEAICMTSATVGSCRNKYHLYSNWLMVSAEAHTMPTAIVGNSYTMIASDQVVHSCKSQAPPGSKVFKTCI